MRSILASLAGHDRWGPDCRHRRRGHPCRRTRLAPSPTGALHLGNARTFLVNWALARQRGWEILLRIEDLDGPRTKPGAADEAIDVLEWLGLDWDEGPVYQSRDLSPYQDALATLGTRGARLRMSLYSQADRTGESLRPARR